MNTQHASDTTLNEDYQPAGFGATLAFGKRPALVVVDVVQAYVVPSSPLYAQGFVDALESNRRLVGAARRRAGAIYLCGV